MYENYFLKKKTDYAVAEILSSNRKRFVYITPQCHKCAFQRIWNASLKEKKNNFKGIKSDFQSSAVLKMNTSA